MKKQAKCKLALIGMAALTFLFSNTAIRAQGYFDSEESSVQSTAPADASKTSSVQNAVIEGIQITSEKGEKPDEKIVTVYFIFRDKPTSYFYEAKPRENKIVFEFNDTEVGVSPIPSMQESPIQGFRVEPTKVDINAEVKGLTPEWHDVIKVSFFMDAIPEITVKDEYSVISFSFPWSTDPDKVRQYVQVDEGRRTRALLFSIGGGVGLAAAAGVVWYFMQDEPPDDELQVISVGDLPDHPNPHFIP